VTVPRNVVFVDVDGVLNSHGYIIEHGIEALDPMNVGCLNYILRSVPSAEVVISSTWRLDTSLARLRSMLADAEFQYGGRIVDCTPQVLELSGAGETVAWRSVDRGHEIESWLRLRKFRGRFVILDDEPMGRLALHHVKTDPKYGLQLTEAERAVDILKRQSEWP